MKPGMEPIGIHATFKNGSAFIFTLSVECLHQVLLFYCFIKLFYSEYIMQCQSTCVTFYLTLTITLLTKHNFWSAEQVYS